MCDTLHTDCLVALVLNTPVDTLYNIYTGDYDVMYKLSLFFGLDMAYTLRYLLYTPDTVALLCKTYTLQPVSVFSGFLNSHDVVYGLVHLPLTYVSQRWRCTTTEWKLIEKCSHRTDIIDYILESEDLSKSLIHLSAAAVATCHDVTLSLPYLKRYNKLSRNYHECKSHITLEVLLKDYDRAQWESVGIDFDNLTLPLSVIVGTGKLNKHSVLDVNVYTCAVLCSNVELTSNLNLIPEHLRCTLDMTIPSLESLFMLLVTKYSSLRLSLSNEMIDYLGIDSSFSSIPSFKMYLQSEGQYIIKLSMFEYLVTKGVDLTEVDNICSLVAQGRIDEVIQKIHTAEEMLWLDENGYLSRQNIISCLNLYRMSQMWSGKAIRRLWMKKYSIT